MSAFYGSRHNTVRVQKLAGAVGMDFHQGFESSWTAVWMCTICSRYSCSNTRSSTPFLDQRFMRAGGVLAQPSVGTTKQWLPHPFAFFAKGWAEEVLSST
jgi:hypothetical protein